MNIHHKLFLIALLAVAVLSLYALADDNPSDVPMRMANGTVIEGTMQEVTPNGLVIQGPKGKFIAPWKYLSAGTRYRHERPLLATHEAVGAVSKIASTNTAVPATNPPAR